MKRVAILSVRVLLGILLGTLALHTFVFVPKIANNMHRSFLRYKMKDVVYVTNFAGTGGGTGWVTTAKSGRRVIITNTHVCQGASFDGKVRIDYDQIAEIIKEFPLHDLCAISVPIGRISSGFTIARSVKYGEEVFTLGHPLLQPSTISPGELSGPYTTRISVGENVEPNKCTGDGYELITDPAQIGLGTIFGVYNFCVRTLESESSPVIILPGNSGSPTVNIYGNVVAVAYAANESGTRSFHVPLEYIKQFLRSL